MRYDVQYEWLLSKDEFLQAGYDDEAYKSGRKRGHIHVLARACKGKPIEIIFKDLPQRMKSLIKQKFVNLNEQVAQTMLEGKMMGLEMTEIAIENTAASLVTNAPFIKEELEGYIQVNFSNYVHYYLQLGISGKSVLGYSKICAFATWIHGVVKKIMIEHEEKRDQNRLLRSFRANLLEVINDMPPFEVKIPTNEFRFGQWVDQVITRLNQGELIEEIIELKRKGNTNTTKLTSEQEKYIASLYITGNSMTVMQVHDKMVEYGRTAGWWRTDGEYKPVSYGTIRNYIIANENRLSYSRQDPTRYFNDRVAQFIRELPKKINQGWGIDGTAHNENVFYRGNVKQYLYAIRIHDYASTRLLDTTINIGVSEPASLLVEALKSAIRRCGYKPAILQCDKGPGKEGLDVFCKENGILLIPAGAGRARSKMIEPLIGMMDNLILRFNPGWSGMNRTAQGANSHPSDEYFKKGKATARSVEAAAEDLRTRCMDEWNSRIIETREGQPCLKTPAELWNEMESETPQLQLLELARITAIRHTVKLTNEGLTVRNKNQEYIYFPPINTEEQRIIADEIFSSIPRNKQEGSQCEIQILEYGKPAPVFKGIKYLGTWEIKKRIPMFAAFNKDTEEYNKMSALQRLQITNAREQVNEIKAFTNNMPDSEGFRELASTPLTGKKRVTGIYDKAELNAGEIMDKAGIPTVDPVAAFNEEVNPQVNCEYKTLVDPDTGEQYVIPINKL